MTRTIAETVATKGLERPRSASGLESTPVGDQMIFTRDGSLHLAVEGAEIAVVWDLDGTRSVADLALAHPGVDVVGLVAEFAEAGLLAGTEPVDEPAVVFTGSGVELSGFDRFVAAMYRSGARHLVAWPAAIVVVALGLTGTIAGLSKATTGGGIGDLGSATVMLTSLIVVGWVATIAHETAHALVIHDHGRRVGRVGMGFYWGSLSFYVDATDALFLRRRHRAAQAAAGPLSDIALAGLWGLLAWATWPSPVGLIAAALLVEAWIAVAINLTPLLKLDGYWLLADTVEIPDLAERARHALMGRYQGPHRVGLVAYAVASYLFGAALLASAIAAEIWVFAPLVADAWRSGLVGKASAVAFWGPLFGGLAASAAGQLTSHIRSANGQGATP